MESDTQMTCPSCGKPVDEGAAFCANCGAAVGGEAAAAGAAAPQAAPPSPGVPPPPPQAPPTGGQGVVAPAAGPAPGTPPKRGKAGLIVGVLVGALIVAGIVVLVLWLTMWRGGGGGGTGSPLELAEKFISAMQKGDVDAYLDSFEAGFLEDEEELEGLGMDLKELLKMTFSMMDVSFKGYELKLESESGGRATVVTTKGTMVMSVWGFEEEFDLAENPMVFEMVKKGGRWYLTGDPMPGSSDGGLDFDLDDYDLDLDDYHFDLDDYDFEDFDFEDFDYEGLGL